MSPNPRTTQTLTLKICVGLVALPKLPIGRCNPIKLHPFSITSTHLKRQGLPHQVLSSHPILSPNPRHGCPLVSVGAFDVHLRNITGIANVIHQNLKPIRVPCRLEPDTPTFGAGDTTIFHRDDPSFVHGNGGEHFHGQVKVFLWRVAPMVYIWKGVIWGTEICCSYFD